MKIKTGRRLLALSLCVILSLSSCGGQGDAPDAGDLQETGGSTDLGGVTDDSGSMKVSEALAPPTAFLSEEDMALADMWPDCDDRALGAVMRKAEANEEVTIVCIGGSITQGTISGGDKDNELLKSGEIPAKAAYACYHFLCLLLYNIIFQNTSEQNKFSCFFVI